MPRLSQKLQNDINFYLAQADELTFLDAFKPNPGGGELFFRSGKHQIFLFGGNKSGKTLQSLAKMALRTIPEKDANGANTGWFRDPYVRRRIPNRKLEAWISCYSQPVQKETIQPVFDLIFGPYIKNTYSESGIYKQVELEYANINFKWQEASKKSYEGANVDLIMWDEPHDKQIYHEMLSRFAKTRGYIWGAATLIIDPEDPDAAKKLKYIDWIINDYIKPWEADPASRPELDIIYANIRENPHIDADFQMSMWAGLSEQERIVRETGRYYNFIGNSCFSREMLADIDTWLVAHPEISEPRYGYLEYDEGKVVFGEKAIQEFPARPHGEFVVKIWEHPNRRNTEYFIGADAAEGVIGGDYTSAYVRRADTRRVVASVHGHISDIEFAKQLNLLGMYYCNSRFEPAMLAIETNGFGNTVTAYLINGNIELGIAKYGISRLYHRPINDDIAKGRTIVGNKPGWYTSNRTRNYLLTAMRQAVVESYDAIQHGGVPSILDKDYIYEAMNFILNKNGKFEATKDVSNDDRLFSLAICDKCVEQYYRVRPDRQSDKVLDSIWILDNNQPVLNIDALVNKARKDRQPERMVY